MKKLIVTACAAIASAVALASTVESSNVFGVLKVDTGSAVKKQTVISVPWVAVGTGGDINPSALVLASKLDQGDMLYVYGAVGSSDTKHQFGAWTVSSSKEWTTTGVSAPEDSIYTTGESTTVSRGISVVVETAQRYIYLSGQYADSSSDVDIKPAVESDGKKTPSYTLIGGNFAAKDVDLNDDSVVEFSVTPDARDEIRLSLTESYTRNTANTAWQRTDGTEEVKIGKETRKVTKYAEDNVKIPAGRGAWYIRKGTGNLKMTFKGVNE